MFTSSLLKMAKYQREFSLLSHLHNSDMYLAFIISKLLVLQPFVYLMFFNRFES